MFIQQLAMAIQNEYQAYHYYSLLKDRTNNPLFVDWITIAMEEERGHYESLQQLYYSYTQSFAPVEKKEEEMVSFRAAVLQSLESELEAAEMYRNMILEIPTQEAYKPLFVAMTDEQEHAIRFGTILGMMK
ncbi:ferritin-like domain-containing protein [Mangrovibacillus cuniculi]|uniref:Ferritin-like domain-containing protein n=1 Tax=Mangrovibacillus cuniculi TaxID=2593652 RepID=A0A7S8HEP8_9BACI|nr:ferritin-like domain-containing protein [Mangrovibacillus cuniculi]QPC45968.1 ferritin-like domain-containing protein [Mangrovibacillus cuniculi]